MNAVLVIIIFYSWRLEFLGNFKTKQKTWIGFVIAQAVV